MPSNRKLEHYKCAFGAALPAIYTLIGRELQKWQTNFENQVVENPEIYNIHFFFKFEFGQCI